METIINIEAHNEQDRGYWLVETTENVYVLSVEGTRNDAAFGCVGTTDTYKEFIGQVLQYIRLDTGMSVQVEEKLPNSLLSAPNRHRIFETFCIDFFTEANTFQLAVYVVHRGYCSHAITFKKVMKPLTRNN